MRTEVMIEVRLDFEIDSSVVAVRQEWSKKTLSSDFIGSADDHRCPAKEGREKKKFLRAT